MWIMCRQDPLQPTNVWQGPLACKSAQAIGQALKRNPRAPRIPCHRVISESRCIGGYSGKTDGPAVAEKRALLSAEGITFDAKGRVCAHHIIAILATDKRASPATTEKQEVPSLLAATRCPTYAHLRAQRESFVLKRLHTDT